jgi:hypothetical protein
MISTPVRTSDACTRSTTLDSRESKDARYRSAVTLIRSSPTPWRAEVPRRWPKLRPARPPLHRALVWSRRARLRWHQALDQSRGQSDDGCRSCCAVSSASSHSRCFYKCTLACCHCCDDSVSGDTWHTLPCTRPVSSSRCRPCSSSSRAGPTTRE